MVYIAAEEGERESINLQGFEKDLVVCGRKLTKSYGTKGNKTTVLEGLSLNVERGTIYGLLGSSGCGKTTLLACIVGARKIDSGKIWVLGGSPGEKGCGVPGPSVGYMPQELSLIERFTIAENLRFFGLLCGRNVDFIKKRTKELIELLELPEETRWAKNLSGGQKRRLSLAIAILHSPQLLVLDEPTVGVDPILRVNIWHHLKEITANKQMTVIVTTHYIEEAKEANTVGLMRNGVLLAEDNPESLMEEYCTTSLEEVFLKLAERQIEEIPHDSHQTTHEVKSADPILKQKGKLSEVSGFARVQVLIWKLLVDTCRNPSGYFFIFILPILQTTLFCVTVGLDPTGLHLGIVNDETRHCETFALPNSTNCKIESLSCQYLKLLADRKSNAKQELFDTLEEAERKVKEGKSWGVLYFHKNFTNNLLDRWEHGQAVKEDILNASTIDVTLDMSNEAISNFLQTQIYTTLSDLFNSLSSRCGWDPRIFQTPYKWNPEVYGVDSTSFAYFIVPGILAIIGFLLSAASTGGYVMTDKEEGITERSKVCGLNSSEACIAYIIINTFIAAVQSALSMVLIFKVFALPNIGSWTLTYVLLFLQGVSGVTFGLLISTVVDNLVSFTYTTVGYNFSSLFISGYCWPIEGMHEYLQYIAKITHFTLIIQAFRSILFRGWDISKEPVYTGFAVTITWIVIHAFLIFKISHSKQKSE